MMFRAWLLALLAFLSSTLVVAQDEPASAENPEGSGESLPLLVDVELSTDSITVGDHVEATVMVVWMGEETTEPARFPTWQESWGRAEVLNVGDVQEVNDASGRRIWRQDLTLTAFRPGEVELPSVTVALPLQDRTLEAVTKPAGFTVGSVLPAPPDEEAAGAVPPGQPGQPGQAEIPEPKGSVGAEDLRSNPRNFWWSVGVLSALLLVGLVWTAGAVANQPESADSTAEPIDPLRLLSPLDELKERLARLDPSAAEPLHTGLSQALRIYLGRRLQFRAVESTTTEIQRALRRAALSADVHHRVVRLLRDADAVKFARAEVVRDVASRRLVEASDLAREVEHEMAPTERPGESSTDSVPTTSHGDRAA